MEVILDASALLALIQNERGADRVVEALPRAAISAVNLAEVVTKLVQKTKNLVFVRKNLDLLKLCVQPWEERAANQCGAYAYLAASGLSPGDRACITESDISAARILTADRRWKEIPEIAARVDLIR